MNLLKFQRFTILHGYRFIALFCGLQALYIEVVFHIYIYPTIHNKSTFMTNNISPSTTNQQSWLTISHHPQQINSHDWQYPTIHNKSTVITDNIPPSTSRSFKKSQRSISLLRSLKLYFYFFCFDTLKVKIHTSIYIKLKLQIKKDPFRASKFNWVSSCKLNSM